MIHKDKFKISTNGLPDIPKQKSEKQEFLAKGYRLYLRDGSWYAERDKESIKIKESKDEN